MRRVVVFGTGGLGRETHAILDALGATTLGFLDGDASKHGQRVHDLPVLGGADWVAKNPGAEVALAVGDPRTRKRLRDELAAAGARFATVVHPRAVVGPRVEIGEGSIVFGMASATTDVRLGRFVVVNPGATLAHDDVLEDFVLAAPGVAVSGNVHVEEGAYLGTNACILQGRRVGAWSTVGAGAVVTRDVPPQTTVMGVPARWQTQK